MLTLEHSLAEAVRYFWMTRARQMEKQGSESGKKDTGNRSAVTGGKHADGFVRVIQEIVTNACPVQAEIRIELAQNKKIPGHFRSSKSWDIVVTSGLNLIAVVEIKSQVGSFGNNFNNRVEEALGNSFDLLTAYRKGLYQPSVKPWLGYVLLLEDTPSSTKPQRNRKLKPFPVDAMLQGQSYAQQYVSAFVRMMRESCYNAACVLMSNRETGIRGEYREPDAELGIRRFAASLHAQIVGYTKYMG